MRTEILVVRHHFAKTSSASWWAGLQILMIYKLSALSSSIRGRASGFTENSKTSQCKSHRNRNLVCQTSKKAVYLPHGLERGCHRNGDYIESFCSSFHSFNTAYTTSTQQHNFNHTSTHTNSSMDRKREYVQRDTWYEPIQRTRTRSLHTKGTALKS